MIDIDTARGADGRRSPERQYNITEIWDNQQEILRRLVLGQSAVDIAEDLGISPQTVSNVRNSPLGQKALSQLQAAANADTVEVAKRIREVAPKAVQVLDILMSTAADNKAVLDMLPADRKTAVIAAFGVLDRAGHAPLHRSVSVQVPVSEDVINEIKDRARSAGAIRVEQAEQAVVVE